MTASGASGAARPARSKWRNISSACTPGVRTTSIRAGEAEALRKPWATLRGSLTQAPAPAVELALRPGDCQFAFEDVEKLVVGVMNMGGDAIARRHVLDANHERQGRSVR